MTDDKNSQIQNDSFEIEYSHRAIMCFYIAATKEKKQAIW